MHPPDDVPLALKASAAVIAIPSSQIAILEKRLLEKVKLRTDYNLLISAPGIGQILATAIILEIATIGRFASVGDFASYARCVDSQRKHRTHKKGEGNMGHDCAPEHCV
ncbi:transposase [Paraburkholderia humisilvae]|uniref:Transposase IS116/IS110/IS902 C-terminal domain-containing protein n=1 Tax=Paraburkholderia humisilvae TaxID=627669 RepID=A0A6J5F4X0_9BURK|nr:transposase [Paraburkholderia humisilvae]CAB3773858.1 hypothetical protein LMG29542_07474 [Paraburkholderia humisilvae]